MAATVLPATSAPTALWGVDSCSSADSIMPATQSAMGTPAFVARYLGANRCGTPGLTKQEAAYIHNQNAAVMLIADTNGPVDGAATADAASAIQSAQALGTPYGTAIFRDVEMSDQLTTAYVLAWNAAFAGSGYVPGFYENPVNGPFSGAWCGAVGQNPGIAASTVLWSDEAEPHYGDDSYAPGAGNAPVWSPMTPPCANSTVAWQYEVRSGFPSNSADPNVDADEFLPSRASLLWGAVALPRGQLLANASFTAGTATSCGSAPAWTGVSGMWDCTYAGDTPTGTGRGLDTVATAVNAALYQDVHVGSQIPAGTNVAATVWLRNPSPTPLPVNLLLAGSATTPGWGDGGVAVTYVNLGPAWQPVQVTFNTTSRVYYLRAQVTNLHGAWSHIEVASTAAIVSLLSNGSFEQASTGTCSTASQWNVSSNGSSACTQRVRGAVDGPHDAALTSAAWGSSLYQDVLPIELGAPGAFTANVWVRSTGTAQSASQASLLLAVSAVNEGWSESGLASTTVPLTSSWQRLQVTVTPTGPVAWVRFQVSAASSGTTQLEIDGATLSQ